MTALQNLSDDLAAVVASVGPSLVAIHARRRIPASGLLWRPDIVVTNHHVIQREDGITVTLADGTSVGASLVGRDPTTDIAVLRLERPATQPVIRPAAGARVGQIVLALGMPGTAVTAALGVISAAGGEWRTWAGGRIDQYLRVDVAVYDGFSGGALTNASGEVIGMNSSGLSRASAMTIPLATVTRVAEQLLKTGRVARGYIGVGLQAVRLPTGVAAQLTPPQDVGLMVVSLDEGAPASAAGIQLGDTIVSFDGRSVTDPGEMLGMLSGERVGTTAPVTLVRAGQVTTTTLTIGERPRASRR
ncbi:MAG: trypsin-like peptidase domain-containing protein [Cytophagaceae bacterium]|nr:trypsin-like peptidase domain-containing protein [Gemmatimonadaceae bacterium]